MLNRIDRSLHIVEQALSWRANVPEGERVEYTRQLINLRRGFKKMKFAQVQGCSTAAFGESQMGKSYLVSAMMSEPGKPFVVTDGEKTYNFIDDINPSNPNSRVESTGVVTRFIVKEQPDVPKSFLKARLLSLSDMILVLCEAYHHQVDYENSEIKRVDDIRQFCQAMESSLGETMNNHPLLLQDDLLDIEQYLEESALHQKVANLTDPDTGFFRFLLMNIGRMTDEQMVASLRLLWNDNENMNRLFDVLLDAYHRLNFSDIVYVPFSAVLKRQGTLLDVARLDEIFDEPVSPPDGYQKFTQVMLQSSTFVEMEKSLLSALLAEIYLSLPRMETGQRDFLTHLDILDFPGARRPEGLAAERLSSGKNLSVILRRGKVTYLFNKYSEAKLINSLLFCHNNYQSAESTMGGVLTDWVNNNVGANAKDRKTYMSEAGVAPLFIVSTFFNLDLVHQSGDDNNPQDIKNRWKNRFDVVLEKEVLKANDDTEGLHWFNNWDNNTFKNIYLLRDFKYSREVFSGYDPNTSSPELQLIETPSFPDFMTRLKASFVAYPEVVKHFQNPDKDWDAAASLNLDGTHRIMASLNALAPNVKRARDIKFNADFLRLLKQLNDVLDRYYHAGSNDDEIRKAQRASAKACLQMGLQVGKNSTAFGRMMDTMMVDEPHLYEIIHKALLEQMAAPTLSEAENSLFMMMGLDTQASREQNLSVVMDFLGASSEDECIQMLESQGVDLNKLLKTNQMATSVAEQVVTQVERYWLNDFLQGYCSEVLKGMVPVIHDVTAMLARIYRQLKYHDQLVDEVDHLLASYDHENAVGMVADMLSMRMNNFVNSFGYDMMTSQQQEKVSQDVVRLRLNISPAIVNATNDVRGVMLLDELDEMHKTLEKGGFNASDRTKMMNLPQYGKMWRWMERLKVGYVFSCDVPDYDIEANRRLGDIISQVKPIMNDNNGDS